MPRIRFLKTTDIPLDVVEPEVRQVNDLTRQRVAAFNANHAPYKVLEMGGGTGGFYAGAHARQHPTHAVISCDTLHDRHPSVQLGFMNDSPHTVVRDARSTGVHDKTVNEVALVLPSPAMVLQIFPALAAEAMRTLLPGGLMLVVFQGPPPINHSERANHALSEKAIVDGFRSAGLAPQLVRCPLRKYRLKFPASPTLIHFEAKALCFAFTGLKPQRGDSDFSPA